MFLGVSTSAATINFQKSPKLGCSRQDQEDAGLAIFWKSIIANPVLVPRVGYILANIFENIASFVSFLDSRDIFIGEFLNKYFAHF